MLGMNSHIIRKLLVTITLLLFTGAAWGQSRLPTSPGSNTQLQSDKEEVKLSPEGQQELPLKDLREQPVRAQEEKADKSLKKQYPLKPKSRVSMGKKFGVGKPSSGANQDPVALKKESDWWPPKPQPAPASRFSLEVNLRQYLEQDFTAKEDELDEKAEEKGKESENLPQGLKKSIKSQVSSQDTELNDD
jgi:hypothetical protein